MPTVADRNFPIEFFAERVRALDASGVVDYIQMWDQMVGWNPPCLWTPEKTPMAAALPDLDSYADWFPMVGYAAAVAPNMSTAISLDSLRRAPAELVQSMLTLANITKGKSMFHIGAGEYKQAQPYGHGEKFKRKMGRLEDFYQIFQALWENNKTPVNFTGKHTTLDEAWIGVARNHKPTIYGIGGGPKVIDLATTYADGFATMGVMVWSDPERTAADIRAIKEKLVAKGRDPEEFGFAAYFPVLAHEDEGVVDRALDHDLSRWHATIWGRINQGDWEREGLPAPMGADWHYAEKMLPIRYGEDEVREMIGRSTRAHVEKSYLYGTPEKVADQLKPFVEAGVTWVGILDVMPMMLEPAEAATSVDRSIEICRRLKQG